MHLPPATTRSALPSILGRAIGLVLAFVLAWLLVDRGLASWVQHEEAIVGQVARYVPQQDPTDVQTLLSRGPEDAPMTVVLACDPSLPRCRKQLATLVAWEGRASKFLRVGNESGMEMRRLVFLPWPHAAESQSVAQTMHALDAQGLFWGAMLTLAQDPTTWTGATLDRALHGVELDPKRLAHDRDDPEIVLAVQIERTIAEALEIPTDSGLLVAGLPVALTQSEGEALAAVIDQAEAQLAENIKFFGGDVALAQARGLAEVPDRTRERFIHWILIGKKVTSLPGSVSDDVPPAEEEDEDEEEEAP